MNEEPQLEIVQPGAKAGEINDNTGALHENHVHAEGMSQGGNDVWDTITSTEFDKDLEERRARGDDTLRMDVQSGDTDLTEDQMGILIDLYKKCRTGDQKMDLVVMNITAKDALHLKEVLGVDGIATHTKDQMVQAVKRMTDDAKPNAKEKGAAKTTDALPLAA